MFLKKILPAIVLLLTLHCTFAEDGDNNAADSPFNQEQHAAIENIVKHYILDHPKVVVNALISYRQQEMQKRELMVQATIKKHDQEIFNGHSEAVLGNPDGNVTLVEFIDYQCKHCRDMSAIVSRLIKNDDQLKVIVRELPIFAGSSLYAAKAAFAAAQQDKFAAMHHALIDEELPLTEEKVLAIAKRLDLNLAAFKHAIKSKAIDAKIKQNFDLSQKLRIMGTPAFIIGKVHGEQVFFIPGATTYDKLETLIGRVRENN
jgi:protein-disulfide isomerase